jgi:hypothetical protein
MISLGMPYSLNIYFSNMLEIYISLQVDFTRIKRESLLKLSTTTIMASFFLVDLGNPVMKSMEMVSHFQSGIGRGCNSHVGCLCST